MLSTLVSSVVAASAEGAEHHELAVNQWAIGGLVLVILLAMLGGLLAFAGGRDHS